MAVSIRKAKELAASAKSGGTLKEYRILDPHHKPDLRGELGGCKVYRVGVEQRVRMPDITAQFYIDQGKLEVV